MNSDDPAPVVVGVDGSSSALDAVRLAVREAALRNRPLRIVHAFSWPQPRVPFGLAPVNPPVDDMRRYAREIIDEARETATKAAPETEIAHQVIDGAAAPVLLAESRSASLIVLGDRGFGRISGALIGSVASQVATHAECPILITRGNESAGGPVVVGVDGSEISERAVGFAAEEATLRGTALLAVHAWTQPPSIGPGDMQPLVYDVEALEAEEALLLAQSVAGIRERHPDLAVDQRSERGRASKILAETSERAQLLVVGARGHGGFTGLLLGSVSNALLYQSRCPLAVVRVGRT